MKPRYAKQRTWYSCGPAAVINAMKWKYIDVAYNRVYDFVARECKLHNITGCDARNIAKACRKFGIKVKMKHFVSINDMKRTLKAGKSLIVLYTHHKDYWPEFGHYVFIPEYNDGFVVTNGYQYIGSKKEETQQSEVLYNDSSFSYWIPKANRHVVLELSK